MHYIYIYILYIDMALHRNELYNPQVCLVFVEKCKVTTSNSISLADVNKGLQLFTKATTVTESGEIPVVVGLCCLFCSPVLQTNMGLVLGTFNCWDN